MFKFIASYRQKRWTNIFVIYLRYLIGGAFAFSAVPKVLGQRFMTHSGEDAPIATFPHLFETLYRSGFYWEFLGWAQLVAALLLMTQVVSTLGTLIFLPIILNIFVITISYEFAGTPVITGLILLANVFLLMWDHQKLKVLFIPESNNDVILNNRYNSYSSNAMWMYLGLLMFATTVAYVLFNGRNPTGWFLICVAEGLAGLIIIHTLYKRQTLLVQQTPP